MLSKIQRGNPPDSLHNIKHPEAKALIEACLKLNPEDRPSAKQLLDHNFFITKKEDSRTTTNDMMRTKEEIMTEGKSVEEIQEMCTNMLEAARKEAHEIVRKATQEAEEILKIARATVRATATAREEKDNALSLGFNVSTSKGLENPEENTGINTEILEKKKNNQSGMPDMGISQDLTSGEDSSQDLMRSFGGANAGSSATGDLLGAISREMESSTLAAASSRKKKMKTLPRLNSGIKDLAGITVDVFNEDCPLPSNSSHHHPPTSSSGERKSNRHQRKPTTSFDKLLNGAITGLRMASTLSDVVRTEEEVQQIFLSYANKATGTRVLPIHSLRSLCTEFGLTMTDSEFRSFVLTFGSNDDGGGGMTTTDSVTLPQFLMWWRRQNVAPRGNSIIGRRGSALPRTVLMQELKNKYHGAGSMVAPDRLHVKKLTLKDNTFVPPELVS